MNIFVVILLLTIYFGSIFCFIIYYIKNSDSDGNIFVKYGSDDMYSCLHLYEYLYKVRFVEQKKMYGKTEYVCECKGLFSWFPIFKRDTLEECKRDYKQYLKKSLKRRKENKIIYKKVINK